MKITFNDLLNDGSIKISFDGGYSFTDYNITDIHSNGGIVLDESQAFDKIMNQGWLHFDAIEKGLNNED